MLILVEYIALIPPTHSRLSDVFVGNWTHFLTSWFADEQCKLWCRKIYRFLFTVLLLIFSLAVQITLVPPFFSMYHEGVLLLQLEQFNSAHLDLFCKKIFIVRFLSFEPFHQKLCFLLDIYPNVPVKLFLFLPFHVLRMVFRIEMGVFLALFSAFTCVSYQVSYIPKGKWVKYIDEKHHISDLSLSHHFQEVFTRSVSNQYFFK